MVECTHASTQHMKTNPRTGPINGMKRRENEMASDVKTITMRYADVAIELRIPV